VDSCGKSEWPQPKPIDAALYRRVDCAGLSGRRFVDLALAHFLIADDAMAVH
jgi:hypothetical protein